METSQPVEQESQLVVAQGIVKTFPGVTALTQIDFELRRGEVHALVGENGAGKSTLIKIISGVYPPSAGHVSIRGIPMSTFTPHTARDLGVGTVYQGLSLVPTLTVAQTLFLGHEPVTHQPTGWLDRPAMQARAREILREVGLDVPPDIPVNSLSVSQQQLVEIAKVLLLGAEVLILDEPTDKLTAKESHRLFKLVRGMRAAGKGIIYITHKLEELAEIADRITVLRDGRHVGTVPAADTPIAQLIQMMVGRDLREMFPKVAVAPGGELLRVEHLSVPGQLEDINLTLRSGEILGLAGLIGSGRTELAKALMGAARTSRGDVFLRGRRVHLTSPEAAVRHGLALLPEDRHREGLFLLLPVRENIVITGLRGLWLNFRRMREVAQHFVERLHIRTPSLGALVLQLSGGNQQKVVLSKWLATDAKVFIFDEPTQGIDVGSKVEIYRLMGELAQSGAGIVLISSELREILALADRVAVMRRGRLVGTFTRAEATQERILAAAFGDSAA